MDRKKEEHSCRTSKSKHVRFFVRSTTRACADLKKGISKLLRRKLSTRFVVNQLSLSVPIFCSLFYVLLKLTRANLTFTIAVIIVFEHFF
jgi:hypothetical protein